jgi:hypothetical protein
MNQIVTTNTDHHITWNKGKLIGQKTPIKLKEIWADTYSPSIGEQNTGIGSIQSGHRQQAARM